MWHTKSESWPKYSRHTSVLWELGSLYELPYAYINEVLMNNCTHHFFFLNVIKCYKHWNVWSVFFFKLRQLNMCKFVHWSICSLCSLRMRAHVCISLVQQQQEEWTQRERWADARAQTSHRDKVYALVFLHVIHRNKRKIIFYWQSFRSCTREVNVIWN